MIKANELRIGNWIIIDNGEKEKYFYEVRAHDIEEIDGYGKDCFPIQITPEILEKCGFELFPWGWVKKSGNDFGIRLQRQSFSYEVSGNNPVKIKYLHQLQNLYFALTGEELSIELNKQQ